MEKEEKIKKENKPKIISVIIFWMIFIIFLFIGVKIMDNYSSQELSELRDETVPKGLSQKSSQKQSSENLNTKQLNSIDDSINFLLGKFPDIILGIKDYGSSVHITVSDSFWYNLTTSQRQIFTDRLLDVLYASGNVNRILYVQDEGSHVVAKR